MKTWILIRVLGEIIAVVGPVPYTLQKCNTVVEERSWLREKLLTTGTPLEDVTLSCIRSATQPKTTVRVKPSEEEN